MRTTCEEIKEWLQRGKEQEATHMLVVCDTYDHEDYPVYVLPGDDVRAKVKEHNNLDQMSRVMEVYSYARSLEEQLAAGRVHNLD